MSETPGLDPDIVADMVDHGRKTRVVLVRHGVPEPDGTLDPGLSEVGRAQARAVGEWLEFEQPTVVASSPLRRALETAEPLAVALGVDIEVYDGLREWKSATQQYGLMENLIHTERGKSLAAGYFEGFVPEHDRAALRESMVTTVTAIAQAHPGGTVVVVGHGGAINNFLAHVVRHPGVFFFNPAYTSLSRIEVMPSGRLVPVSINETGHLVAKRTE